MYGRPEILHSRRCGILIIRKYGLGPRHTSQRNGKSSPRRRPSGTCASVAPGLAAACAIFADDDPADMDDLAALAELSLRRPRASAASTFVIVESADAAHSVL